MVIFFLQIISLDGHFYKATNIPFPNSDIKLRLLDQVLTPVHDEQNPFERYERQSENEFERVILRFIYAIRVLK